MSDITTITCRICSKEIKQESEFHIKLEFPSEENVTITENTVVCTECNEEIDDKDQSHLHNISTLIKEEIKEEVNVDDHETINSTELSENAKGLKTRLIKHSGGRRFSCDECDYESDYKELLALHKIINSDEKLLKCNLCGFRSKYLKSLNIHKVKHSRPFGCDKCDYKTTFKCQLVSHKISHSKKFFKCNFCKFNSVSLDYVKLHMMQHSTERAFRCDKCDYSTESKWHLLYHEERIHAQEKTNSSKLLQ